MIKFIDMTGKTEDEALSKALEQLGKGKFFMGRSGC